MKIFESFEDYMLNENFNDFKFWYHGSSHKIKKFIYDRKVSEDSQYYGYGIYFASDVESVTRYGDNIHKVEIKKGSNIINGKITVEQCKMLAEHLVKLNLNTIENLKYLTNPTYGNGSIVDNTEYHDLYFRLKMDYPKYFKWENKNVSDFLLEAGFDGMYIKDDDLNFLVIFNENVIKIVK